MPTAVATYVLRPAGRRVVRNLPGRRFDDDFSFKRVSEQIWPEGWNPAQVKPHPAGYDEWKARRQEQGRDDEEN